MEENIIESGVLEAIRAIVNKELDKYKDRLKVRLIRHFENSYCDKVNTERVIYQSELFDLIDNS